MHIASLVHVVGSAFASKSGASLNLIYDLVLCNMVNLW